MPILGRKVRGEIPFLSRSRKLGEREDQQDFMDSKMHRSCERTDGRFKPDLPVRLIQLPHVPAADHYRNYPRQKMPSLWQCSLGTRKLAEGILLAG